MGAVGYFSQPALHCLLPIQLGGEPLGGLFEEVAYGNS